MDKRELAVFLRTRRERLQPQDVGLPSGSRRRTAGLRREEVAALAHISTEYYVRLEQGRAPRPSSGVLAGIGGALRLTDAESEHLHVLAGAAPSRAGLVPRDVRPSIRALLERLSQTAAFVMSASFDVLAWNGLAVGLMEDFGELEPEDRNLARRAFLGSTSGDTTLYGISDATQFRLHVVAKLRTTVARYPADRALLGLVDELIEGNSDFARLWDRHDVQSPHVVVKTFRHPVVGDVTVNCDTLALVEQDQEVVLFSASEGSPSAEKLAFLGVVGAQGFDAGRTR